MLNQYLDKARDHAKQSWAKLTSAENRARARELRNEVSRAFTEHPQEAGETYWEHLWFTSSMSARFLYTTIVIMIHGIFPFLLTRTASEVIDNTYRIMKARIPKSRREAIDAADDYSV